MKEGQNWVQDIFTGSHTLTQNVLHSREWKFSKDFAICVRAFMVMNKIMIEMDANYKPSNSSNMKVSVVNICKANMAINPLYVM